jgi:hypothetical protein
MFIAGMAKSIWIVKNEIFFVVLRVEAAPGRRFRQRAAGLTGVKRKNDKKCAAIYAGPSDR